MRCRITSHSFYLQIVAATDQLYILAACPQFVFDPGHYHSGIATEKIITIVDVPLISHSAYAILGVTPTFYGDDLKLRQIFEAKRVLLHARQFGHPSEFKNDGPGDASRVFIVTKNLT